MNTHDIPIQPERVVSLNRKSVRERGYIVYWMQASQRASWNHALEFAIHAGNERGKPVVALFMLYSDYPEANERHFTFMLQGLKETHDALRDRNIALVVRQGGPDGVAGLAAGADMVVTDRGYLRIQREWRRQAAEKMDCAFIQVESDSVVPVALYGKEAFSAGVLRPTILKALPYFLVPVHHGEPKYGSLTLDLDSIDISDTRALISGLNLDRSVQPPAGVMGGTSRAEWLFREFLAHKLDRYHEFRNHPELDFTSGMSPYLHFGQISPVFLAFHTAGTESPGKESFLDELVVRRELSHNFAYYNTNYDSIAGLPEWALLTLKEHRQDAKEFVYPLDILEKAQSHDPYWNAAQKEMVLTGKMHGYMRMYWGKKILEWSASAQEAYRNALALNNKYELDGRDPNGFAGVAWCFGKHDRAWPERPVYGKVRSMTASGLERKLDIGAYVRKVEAFSSGRSQITLKQRDPA